MILRNINSTEIEAFSELTIPKKLSFKNTLLSWLKDGITKLEWCFVIENNNNFLGRIVYGVFDNDLVILDINIKVLNDGIEEKLLQGSLEEMKLKGFNGVECHLYSDKIDFKQYVQTLIISGFNIVQEKKSFIWEKANINKLSERLLFKSLEEIDSTEYINAIKEVTKETLDQDDLNCIKEFGSEQAAIKYFNQLKDIDFNKSWWSLAYTKDNELIGLVIPQKFNDDVGAINYIGVIPKKRGNGYVNDLLIKGITILSTHNITKVIADIDVKNYPLEKALYKEGFKLDCSMLVLKLNF